MTNKKATELIAKRVTSTLALEEQLKDAEAELMQIEKFRRFMELKQEFDKQWDDFWNDVKEQMIENDIRSIKGDWGSLTIAERTDFDIDMDALKPRFTKRVADIAMIRNLYKLHGEAPAGTTVKTVKYLTKRLKGDKAE